MSRYDDKERVHPFSSSLTTAPPRQSCQTAALNIMELVAAWKSLYTVRYVPVTFIQAVFSAGTVWLLAAVTAGRSAHPDISLLSHSLTQAELCVDYLLETGRSFQCANHIAGILKNLLQGEVTRFWNKTTPAGPAAPHAATMMAVSSNRREGSSSNPSSSSQPRHMWYLGDTTPEHGSMRGGGALSNWPIDPNPISSDQLESQLGIFADDRPQEDLVWTDDVLEKLTVVLSQLEQYPYPNGR